jgi:hypothetical protein
VYQFWYSKLLQTYLSIHPSIISSIEVGKTFQPGRTGHQSLKSSLMDHFFGTHDTSQLQIVGENVDNLEGQVPYRLGINDFLSVCPILKPGTQAFAADLDVPNYCYGPSPAFLAQNQATPPDCTQCMGLSEGDICPSCRCCDDPNCNDVTADVLCDWPCEAEPCYEAGCLPDDQAITMPVGGGQYQQPAAQYDAQDMFCGNIECPKDEFNAALVLVSRRDGQHPPQSHGSYPPHPDSYCHYPQHNSPAETYSTYFHGLSHPLLPVMGDGHYGSAHNTIHHDLGNHHGQNGCHCPPQQFNPYAPTAFDNHLSHGTANCFQSMQYMDMGHGAFPHTHGPLPHGPPVPPGLTASPESPNTPLGFGVSDEEDHMPVLNGHPMERVLSTSSAGSHSQMMINHKHDDTIFICRWKINGCQCAKRFDTAAELHRHCCNIHTAPMNNRTGYKCSWDGCQKRDRFNSAYEDPLAGNPPARRARRSGEEFTQRSKLDRHLQTHTGREYLF